MKPSTSISRSLRFGRSLIRKVKHCFTGYKPTDRGDGVKSVKNCMYYSDMSTEQRNEKITLAIRYCKVANFEYIDEVEAAAAAAAEEEARKASTENKTTTNNPDSGSYWEELLKDRYEVQKVDEFDAMERTPVMCSKTKCKDFQLSGQVKSMPFAYMQHGRRDSSAVALVPSSGTVNITKQSKEILFPYEDFVELFNWDKRGFPPCGLLNCGNSCFANVVLQCLVYTRPLVAYLLEKGHRKECRRNDWCFLCEFQTHVKRSSESRHPFSPINILSRLPNIGGDLGYGKQEDAHEFMRFAIDTMQSVCLDEFGGEKALHPSTQETTLIQHIFGGHLQSQEEGKIRRNKPTKYKTSENDLNGKEKKPEMLKQS